MDPRVMEVKDITTVIDEKDSNSSRNAFQDEAFDCMKKCATSGTEKQGVTSSSDSDGDLVSERARKNAENPELQEAYKQMLEATKGLDPKLVEDSLLLASDLAESGLANKLPGLAKAAAEMEKEQKAIAEGDEGGLVDPRISSAWQTILRKFTNPLVIKDVIAIGKDLAQIAMSPQGRQLISDIRSLVKHFKEA